MVLIPVQKCWTCFCWRLISMWNYWFKAWKTWNYKECFHATLQFKKRLSIFGTKDGSDSMLYDNWLTYCTRHKFTAFVKTTQLECWLMYFLFRGSLAADIHHPLTLLPFGLRCASLLISSPFVHSARICGRGTGLLTMSIIYCELCDKSANHTFNELLPLCIHGNLSSH